MTTLKVYDYRHSSAAYRLRIALQLKGVAHEMLPINILAGHDEQFLAANRARNPQARVPFIETDRGALNQSLAIIEWLDDVYTSPALLPDDPWERAQARAFALTVACDIHPLNNLSVLARLRLEFSTNEDHITAWCRHWIAMGFAALEAELKPRPETTYLFGEQPTLADICLVPQMVNARRYKMDLSHFPRLVAHDERARAHPAFVAAAAYAPKE